MKNAKFKDLTLILQKILREKNVRKAVLFGSAARGTDSGKSDLDLMILDEIQEIDGWELFTNRLRRCCSGDTSGGINSTI